MKTKNQKLNLLTSSIAIVLGLIFAESTNAQEIVPIEELFITSESVTITGDPVPAPLTPVPNGLLGTFRDVEPVDVPFLNSVLDIIEATEPDATFLSTAVDYPLESFVTAFNSNTLVTEFLGPDGDSFTPAEADATLEGSIFEFTGLIDITEELDQDSSTEGINVTFVVGSDDGFQLSLGDGDDLLVISQDPTANNAFNRVFTEVTFLQPGLYPIELVYFENDVVTGIEFSGIFGDDSSDIGIIIPNGFLLASPLEIETTPEPTSMLALLFVSTAALASRQNKNKHTKSCK